MRNNVNVSVVNLCINTTIKPQFWQLTMSTNRRRLSRHDDVDSTFEELKDEAEETDASSHSRGTLKDYKTKYYEIVRWLKRKQCNDALNTPRTEIDFSGFNALHLKAFLQTKKMVDLTGQVVQDYKHNLDKYRSAIKFYRVKNTVDDNALNKHSRYETSMKKYFSAIAKREALLVRQGRLVKRKGQKHMSASIYKYFCEVALGATQIYLHVFCIFMWASVGRSDNIQTTNLSHFGVYEDAITVDFPMSKGDNEGVRDHTLHFFSNPDDHRTCFFFALGMYFLNSKAFPDGNLFTGSKTKAKTFICCMKRLVPNEYLTKWVGYGWEYLNNHAWRKGVMSYLTGGVEDPPPQVNLDCRAGHFPHEIKEVYYAGGQPGDQQIGQLASGKRIGTAQMYQLCPYFKDPESAVIKDILPVVFEWYEDSSMPVGFEAVARRALASVVWHLKVGKFQVEYPDHAVLLESPLMEGSILQRLISELGDHTVVNNSDSSSVEDVSFGTIDKKPELTGIFFRDRRMARVEKNTDPQTMGKLMRENMGGGGNSAVVLERLESNHRQMNLRMDQIESRFSTAYGAVSPPTSEEMPMFKHADGLLYKVPEDFVLPSDYVLPAFKKWLVGDKKQKVGPFRNIFAADIPRSSEILKKARKRLSDWRFVMCYYESKLDDIDGLQWRDNFNFVARRYIIHEVRKLAPLCKTGSTPTLITVRTVAAKLRKFVKK